MTNVVNPEGYGLTTFFIFACCNFMIMILILTLVIVMSMLSIFIISTVKNRRTDMEIEFRYTFMPWLFLSASVLILSDLVCGGDSLPVRLVCDLLLALMAVLVLYDSLRSYEDIPLLLKIILICQGIVSVFHLLSAVGLIPLVSGRLLDAMAVLYAAVLLVYHSISIWLRLREIKAVMKSGTVWTFLCLCVDVIYFSAPAVIVMMMCFCSVILPEDVYLQYHIAAVLLTLELVAVGLRMLFDTQFVILQKHENIIVESMRISQIEMCSNSSREDQQYKDIYERVVLHFEMSKPFLKGDLTINDIVKVVFSNKVYISKAISHYTGRNFRQFVNYHRVMYSMELFRKRPDLKVAELSEQSGFNTVVSFTMAFRLFVNETPSEWCRKERARLLKTKN